MKPSRLALFGARLLSIVAIEEFCSVLKKQLHYINMSSLICPEQGLILKRVDVCTPIEQQAHYPEVSLSTGMS